MCLDTRYPPDVEKKMIAKLPEEFVVYRTVRKCGEKYYCRFSRGAKSLPYKFRKGNNVSHDEAKIYTNSYIRKKYEVGFHSFRAKRGAKDFDDYHFSGWRPSYVIKAIVRRKDITSMGKQKGYIVIVSRKIIMPDPKDKKAVVA